MFEKVVTWLKVARQKTENEPPVAEMKELAEHIEHGDPTDIETLKRMAQLLGQIE